MSDDAMITPKKVNDGNFIQILSDGSTRPIEDRTDWARLTAMVDDDIAGNALSNPDNPPLTDGNPSGQ